MKSIIEKLGITPGPWNIDINATQTNYMITAKESDRHRGYICTLAATNKDSESNAIFIAAAPEMFLWVYGMVNCAEKGDMVKAAKLLELGRELIKKATGLEWEELYKLIGENE